MSKHHLPKETPKTAQFFNNRFIPAVVVPVTALVYALIQVSSHLMQPGPHPLPVVFFGVLSGQNALNHHEPN